MPRPRVLSFMTAWSSTGSDPGPNSPTRLSRSQTDLQTPPRRPLPSINTATPSPAAQQLDNFAPSSPVPSSPGTPSRARADSRATYRPESMVQTYQPPQMDLAQDTPPELAPIFSYLNSHSNKLYQEGYFLKLHDLDSRGRPSSERVWVECFAQLVGTVLSLWDAAALDAAGEDGEVVPTFINLSDASLKMIESLPMSGAQGGSLQNVLSISTAANNRYLLHFNSYSSLTQWTAGIRLAMFEHATLQEAYTGSLIAGKGRFLNNIKTIMERARFIHEDWARVRFGAGTPWKRCWCVVNPPDEKEYQKSQKSSKKSAYERGVNIPKGNIKFYDTRKVTKKTRPIATITDAYAAYAIYPQSKPLIDQSTLVKLEGLVTIHSQPETTTEGFVFVMPEVHAAVSGFEMMLRWLFPVYDTFGLYGRPQRLIADTLDQRGLMFALPQDRRYGYLDTLDVAGLIHAPGSPAWSERQWRKEMKKLTSERMSTYRENGLGSLRQLSQRRNTVSRTSLPGGQGGVRFDDGSDSSAPPSRTMSPSPRNPDYAPPRRTDSAPPVQHAYNSHKRSASEVQGYRKYMSETPSRLSYEQRRPGEDEDDLPPPPPRHGGVLGSLPSRPGGPGGLERIQSEAEVPTIGNVYEDIHAQVEPAPSHLLPVDSPPAFQHNPGARPANQPIAPPELRRAHSNVDAATLYQMQDAARGQRTPEEEYANGQSNQRQQSHRNSRAVPATKTMQSTYSESTNPNHTTHSDQSSKTAPDDASPLATPLSDDDGSRLNSLQDAFIDQDALERMLENDRTSTMHSATSTEPDYASTVSSNHEERTPVERPRAGKLKTVGNPDLAQHDPKFGRLDTWQHEQAAQKSSVPNINFGPTYAYKPSGRPGTSGTVMPPAVDERNRSGSRDRLRSSGRMTPGGISPVENYRQSYFGGVPDGDHSRSHSRNASVAWTPSGGSPGHQQRQSLTPEQWVQQRAAMASQPHYPPQGPSPAAAHRRTGSSGSFNVQQLRKSMTKTPPPFSRTPSGDWTHLVQDQRTPPSRPHSRSASMHLSSQNAPPSRPLSRSAGMYLNQPTAPAHQNLPTPPSRPHSRSAGVYLNPPSGLVNSSQPTNLSAREQMHVARATGTPLLDTSANARKKKQQQEEDLGLVGAIGAREREKAAMKTGHRSSMVVENAIRARQDQQAEAQMQAYQQQMMQQQQQAAYYAQQQQQAAGYGYGFVAPGTPGLQYGQGVQLTPLQIQQQQMMQQQQQQGAQTPGNRQSWFGGSYFGGLPPQ